MSVLKIKMLVNPIARNNIPIVNNMNPDIFNIVFQDSNSKHILFEKICNYYIIIIIRFKLIKIY